MHSHSASCNGIAKPKTTTWLCFPIDSGSVDVGIYPGPRQSKVQRRPANI